MAKPATNDYTRNLIAGLQSIPVEELVECARRGLTATRRVRLSKDQPEGVEEPDFASQQKALAFIADQIAGKAAVRAAVVTTDADGEAAPKPGKLKA